MDTHITIPRARLIELETAEHERDILRTDNANLAREAHTWSKAAETYAKQGQRAPLDPLDVEELWDKAHEQWNEATGDHADVHEMFARLIERAHGIGGDRG